MMTILSTGRETVAVVPRRSPKKTRKRGVEVIRRGKTKRQTGMKKKKKRKKLRICHRGKPVKKGGL